MRFHPEVLSARQQRALERLAPFLSSHGWYLGGGTALALIYGHRQSVDLDWFTEERLEDPQSWALQIQDAGVKFVVRRVERGTLHGTIGGVRVSLFEYRYPLLQPLLKWTEMNCNLASLDDLTCMKLSAVAQRGSKKDFIDVFALLQHHKPLGELLQLYQKKYTVNDIGPILYGLTYFEDTNKERMPRMSWQVSWPQIKNSIENAVKTFLRESS